MSQLQIRKATKKKLKLRLALEGPSGSGKTFTALAICKAMGWKTLLVDTEHRSSERYADQFEFDIIDLDPPFSPDRYISCIDMAEQGGYDAVVLDSLSHEWFGQGGVLEMVDEEMVRQRTSQAMLGWKVVTPKHTRLLERLIRNNVNLISCMRSKQEYSIEKDDSGKTTIKKLGMAPIQKEGMDYEHDIVGSLFILLFHFFNTPLLISSSLTFLRCCIRSCLPSSVISSCLFGAGATGIEDLSGKSFFNAFSKNDR